MTDLYIGDVYLILRRTTGRNWRYRPLIVQNAFTLSCPKYAREREILSFAAQKVEEKRAAGVYNDFHNDGYIRLFGEKVPVMAYRGTKDSVTEHMGIVYLERKTDEMTYSFRSAVYRFYVKKLQEKLKKRVPIMESYIGIQCAGWSIASVYSVWGKCNPRTQKIVFSAELAAQSVAFIDQVIVHELAHILFPNHGKEFHAFMAKYIPNYKELIKKVKK